MNAAAKPKAMPVLPDAIPDALKALARWVVWKYVEEVDPETGEVDYDKPPVNARTGGLASSTNPKTWGAFAEALAAYQGGGLDGVGFVLHRKKDENGKEESGGLVGVDLDHCRNRETGEIAPRALEIIRELDTYAEVSPSGEGVRLFLYGDLPPEGRKKGDYENYQGGRYVTVTGQRIDGAPATIEHRQEQLLRVHGGYWPKQERAKSGPRADAPPLSLGDDELLSRAAMARNGERFSRLWRGEVAGHNSASEADLALCNYLAFWCGPDEGRIADLFAQSGLYRSKWNREDYRRRTIGKALAGRTEFYTPRANGQRQGNGREDKTTRGNGRADNNGKAKGGHGSVPRPKPRLTPPEPYRPFPTDALPQPLRAFVEQAAASIGCDPVYVALPALSVAASLIGNSRAIRLKRDWTEPDVLWTAIVGPSGTLKTPAFRAAVRPLYALQRTLIKRYKEEFEAWQKEKEAYDARKKKAKQEERPFDEDEPEKPVVARVVCGDTTIEKLAQLLEDNPKGLLVARDELGGWLTSFTRYKGKAGGSDLQNWLELHQAGTIQYDRKTGDRPVVFVFHAAASVCGGIQPGVLAKCLTQEYLDAGLGARILMAMPPRRRKHWTEVEIFPEVREAYETLLGRLRELQLDKGKDGDKEPFALKLTPEAKTAWVRFYSEWAGEQAAVDGELAAAFSKLEAYAARLALLHHVVSRVGDLEDCQPVEAASVEAGVTLAKWFAYEARRIYSALSESEERKQVRELVELLRSWGGSASVRKLQHASGSRYKTADDAEAALQGLVDSGLATWESRPPGPKGGRPTRVCVLQTDTTKTDKTPDDDDDFGDGVPTQPPDTTPPADGIPPVSGGSVGSVVVSENNGTRTEGPAADDSHKGVVSPDDGYTAPGYDPGDNPFSDETAI